MGGHSKITIMVDDEETTFEMSQNKPYLKLPKTRNWCSLLCQGVVAAVFVE
jgi:hypothetical protein